MCHIIYIICVTHCYFFEPTPNNNKSLLHSSRNRNIIGTSTSLWAGP